MITARTCTEDLASKLGLAGWVGAKGISSEWKKVRSGDAQDTSGQQ